MFKSVLKGLTGFSLVKMLILMGLVLSGMFLISSSFAAPSAPGFAPASYPQKVNIGQGAYFAGFETPIYALPSTGSKVVETIYYRHGDSPNAVFLETQQAPVSARNVFVAYYPALDVAILPVLGDSPDGKWAEVVYDQARNLSGWARIRESNLPSDSPTHFGVYQPWVEFMKLNAKKNGVTWLSGVPGYYRSVKTQPEDTAKLVPIQVVKKTFIRHVRGNWMLVEVLDLGLETPMGWQRWREENGQILAFPNFNGSPVMPMMPGK